MEGHSGPVYIRYENRDVMKKPAGWPRTGWGGRPAVRWP